MNETFYKKILENLDLPLCLSDSKGEVLYASSKYNEAEGQKSIREIEIEGEKYSLITIVNAENQAHQDFISTVSHELRTPLTSIRGFADTMIMSSDKLSKEQTNKFLTIIRSQSDRLTRLVENLLEVSNISKKDKFIFKEIDFNSCISPIITMFERKYPSKNFETTVERNLPKIWADSDTLEQILTNLIDNAAKYSGENAPVRIKANYQNDFVQIKIFDEGVKIPEESLEKIFNKFSRIDNPLTRKVDGSGLGLFITKALTEKLNGKVYAQNHEKGNVFTLELPVTTVEKQLGTKISGGQN